MCGIYAAISRRDFIFPGQDLEHLLCNRGPDHIGQAQAQVESDGTTLAVSFTSTVLALRGGHLTPQPFVDPQSGSILCWNGEAWKIGQETFVGNDGQKVFESMVKASTTQNGVAGSSHCVFEVLNSICGPFAFVFLDNTRKQLFFGRDRLGRRSLLYNNMEHANAIEFSSVADPTRGLWNEVEADGIYVLPLGKETPIGRLQLPDPSLTSTSILPVHKYSWGVKSVDSGHIPQPFPEQWEEPPNKNPPLGMFNKNIPKGTQFLTPQSSSVKHLHDYLRESLKDRILNIPIPPGLDSVHNVRVAVLFSGGLDCTVLARIAHDLLPLGDHIDLINVAFENPRVIHAMQNTPKSKNQASLHTQNRYTLNFPEARPFERVSSLLSPFESCPDRETGRKAFQELLNVCPNRVWRFIAVNVPYAETLVHRTRVVSLIHPHNTEMDLSIAYALYFAARGTGIVSSGVDEGLTPYTTPARILLSGLGADELFGGYTRHATAFNRKGFPGLLDELELDVNRLGKRNLGRDDRVMSHWGREARFPYLDEELVKWAVGLPIWEKCGFGTAPSNEQEPHIDPSKKVLRLLAYKLGMLSVAREKKRAIQFGARTAKMEIGTTKGTSLIS